MIEAIEDENPHSLEAIAQYHKHVNMMEVF